MKFFKTTQGLFPINDNIYFKKVVSQNGSVDLHIGYVTDISAPTISIKDITNQKDLEIEEILAEPKRYLNVTEVHAIF